jgi:argininosuccinate lyase
MAETASALNLPRDTFFFLAEINKASAVMLTEREIISPSLGRRIADTLDRLMAAEAVPGAARSADYL